MQQRFNHALFASDHLSQDELLADIKGNSIEQRIQRLNVYRNNVFVSLIEALGEIFPVCKQMVGEDFFNAMARQYIERHPPNSPVLSEYGQYFSEFVSHFFPAQSLPYLASLCDLEYKVLQMTHAAEGTHLSLLDAQTCLNQVSNPDALQLALCPQAELLTYPYAVDQLYLAHQQPTPDLSQIKVQQTSFILLTKSGLFGCIYSITDAEYSFLQALQKNPSLSQAIPKEESFDLGQTLAKLMTWEVFSDIYES